MKNVKSIMTIMIVTTLCVAFLVVVFKMLDVETSKTIVSAFLTIATTVVGFFAGYQTNKKAIVQDKELEKESGEDGSKNI